ncbi:MAG TPA: 50S ribosomal protein L18 [Gammaproteobacteria bacterium]|nr:50S ribosomal protein L18 [Gammaproteobacteria bacterium]
MNKKEARQRRALKTRRHISELGVTRLCVHRTPRHIYAQVLSADGSKVVAAASTLEKPLREALATGGNVEAATAVGKLVAERAIAAGVQEVAFDRSGFKFHGRVKALADAAREHGLKF